MRPNKPMVPTAPNPLVGYSLPSRRRHIGQPLGGRPPVPAGRAVAPSPGLTVSWLPCAVSFVAGHSHVRLDSAAGIHYRRSASR